MNPRPNETPCAPFLEGKPGILDTQRKAIENLLEPYTVRRGDSIVGIARAHGLGDYKDLLAINFLFGKRFRKITRGNNTTYNLQPDEMLSVPKAEHTDELTKQIASIRRIMDTITLNERVTNGEINLLKRCIGEPIYPTQPVSLGIGPLAGAFRAVEATSFQAEHSRTVDVGNQTQVACSQLIRAIMTNSMHSSDLSRSERDFINKKDIHAWILPAELMRIGFEQHMNLMGHIDPNRVGSANPIAAKADEAYISDVRKMGEYLERDGIVGSLVPLYFRGSHFRNTVREYNMWRHPKERHYNTHQSMYIGSDTKTFEAWEVPIVENGVLRMPTDVTNANTDISSRRPPQAEKSQPTGKTLSVTDLLLNFILSRADYSSSALSDESKKQTLKGMQRYASLIHISVNGKIVDIASELTRPHVDQLVIKPSDIIAISGPMMLDGMHMANSDEEHKKNMNTRVRFFFEFITTMAFLPTELIVPGTDSSFHPSKQPKRIQNNLPIKGEYDLRKGETLEAKLRSRIPVFEKNAFDALDPLAKDYTSRYEALIRRFYSLQIKALSVCGYLQSENSLNRNAFNTNRPIPYFGTDGGNIESIFRTYNDESRKQEAEYNKETAPFSDFVRVYTMQGDAHGIFFNRIATYASDHNAKRDRYPNLATLGRFNEVQKLLFLKRFITEAKHLSGAPDIDAFMSGNIKPNIQYVISLEKLEAITQGINRLTFSPTPKMDPEDQFAIDLVAPDAMSRSMLARIMQVESYIPDCSLWTRRMGKAILESFSFLQRGFLGSKISSIGDMQLRCGSLRKWWGDIWPTKDHIMQAIALIETEAVSKHIDGLSSYGKRRAQSDRLQIAELKRIAEMPNPDFGKMVDILSSVMQLDDGTDGNIVGKIMSVSLTRDKIQTHYVNLGGILRASGEPLTTSIVRDPNAMYAHDSIIMLMNNMNEERVVLGLTENLFFRVMEQWKLFGTNKPKYIPIASGSVIDSGTFLEHLRSMRTELSGLTPDTPQKRVLRDALLQRIDAILWVSQGGGTPVETRERIRKTSLAQIHDAGWKSLLAWQKISSSLLPTKDELTTSDDPFRKTFFKYIRQECIPRHAIGDRPAISGDIPWSGDMNTDVYGP